MKRQFAKDIYTTQNIHEVNPNQGVIVHYPWVFDN